MEFLKIIRLLASNEGSIANFLTIMWMKPDRLVSLYGELRLEDSRTEGQTLVFKILLQ